VGSGASLRQAALLPLFDASRPQPFPHHAGPTDRRPRPRIRIVLLSALPGAML
jgi:hypothetical protein